MAGLTIMLARDVVLCDEDRTQMIIKIKMILTKALQTVVVMQALPVSTFRNYSSSSIGGLGAECNAALTYSLPAD